MENELGALLFAKRHELDHSQEEAGKRCGVRGKTISRWEGGEAKPSSRKIVKLCRYLGITLEQATLLFNTPAQKKERAHVS